ncbi:MAG TPA: hypothetical protein VFF06_12720, partial [Polyangia bacterium]|nr:hypothetical protein [Polyangia bacterium]
LSDHATAWLAWLDGAAAIGAFAVASMASEGVAVSRAAGGPLGLALALFLLWIIALATGADHWLAWWTFAFACGFLILGFLGSSQRAPHGGGGVRTTRLA